ncbi:MAG: spherulation-specific family 4 protein [Giesbergeria sp.]|jgi:hypothetical protein|nr:spherulation-specific family 4 protein [Giesbergeria sp.]
MPHPTPFRVQAGALCLAALLSACGGGTETPQPSLDISLTAPAQANQVFTLQAPIAVSARVTVDGASAPDGTAVNFFTPAGSFTPASALTRSGTASTTLTGATAGRQTLTATATLSGVTGSATQTLYLRQPPAPLEVLVPAYFYPSAGGSDWDRLSASALAHPGLKLTAILNPANGIFSNTEPRYLQAAQNFVRAGGHLVGYVYTRYGTGTRSISDIKANIDRYLDLYGRGLISGIFLDEMAANAASLGFYREIYTHIKSRDASLRVLGNPGTVPTEGYAGVADAIVTFEGTGADYAGYDPRQTGDWLYARANSTQAMLVHNAMTCQAMQGIVATAATPLANAGLVYATDRVFNYATQTGNPWATLPSYWTQLLATVAAINQGQALPTCP